MPDVQARFAPPATPKIVPSSIAVAREIVRPHFDPIPEPLPSRPPPPIEEDEDRPTRPDKDDDQRALETAGGFLKTMGWIGLAHTMPCCGCIAVLTHDDRQALGQRDGWVRRLPVRLRRGLLVRPGRGTASFPEQLSLGLTGVAVALLLGGADPVNVPVVLSSSRGPAPSRCMGEPCCGGLMIVPSLLVIVFGLLGGIKGCSCC